MRHAAIVLLALLLTPGLGSAQATPEAAAEAFGAAIRKGEYAAAARIMHPSALRQLRDIFTPILTSPNAGELGKQLFGLGSNAELVSTPDTVLFARFLQTVSSQQGLGDALRSAKFEALGHVTTPGDTALVVSRITMSVQGVTLSSFEVMPFIRVQGAYRGLLKADFTNMAAMMKARFGRSS